MAKRATLILVLFSVVAIWAGANWWVAAGKSAPGLTPQQGKTGADTFTISPSHAGEEGSRESVVPLESEPAHVSAELGRVLDPDGQPAVGAKVNVFSLADMSQELVYTTDVEGTFPLDEATPGDRYKLRATLRGAASARATWQAAKDSAPVLHLGRGGGVMGRVVDDRGVGVPSFQIWVTDRVDTDFGTAEDLLFGEVIPDHVSREGPWEFGPDVDGHFEILGLRPGRGCLLIEVRDGPSVRWNELLIVEEEVSGPHKIEVPGALTIDVIVFDEFTLQPISGAEVNITLAGNRDRPFQSASTDVGGRCRVKSPTYGCDMVVAASDYATARWPVHGTETGTSEVRVSLQARVPIDVLVLDEAGAAMPGARIVAQCRRVTRTGLTDSKGRIEIDDLPPGHAVDLYWLRGKGAFDYRRASQREETVVIQRWSPGEGPGVFGVVSLPSGPLGEGFAFVIGDSEPGRPGALAVTSLDENGGFALGPFESDVDLTLEIRVGGLFGDNDHQYSWAIEIPSEGLEFNVLLEGGAVAGEVFRPSETGGTVPVSGAKVRVARQPEKLRRADGARERMRARALTDATGRFSIAALADGPYELVLEFPDGERAVRRFVIEEKAQVDLGRLMSEGH